MNAINANVGEGGYQLKSDLARVCLPRPHAHDERNLAWVNSICLLFLLVGLLGFRSAPPPAIPVKPLEEPAAVIIEQPPPPPPQVVQDVKPEEQTQDKPEAAPRLVMVARESPAIKFSIPTVGNLIVPESVAVAVAAAPPVNVTQEPAPVHHQPAPPNQLENTGVGGDRPEQKHYPLLAQQMGQQGTVVLLLTADEAGVIVSAKVEQSSGFSILDYDAVQFVKRHWTVPPGANGRLFRTSFKYQLK